MTARCSSAVGTSVLTASARRHRSPLVCYTSTSLAIASPLGASVRTVLRIGNDSWRRGESRLVYRAKRQLLASVDTRRVGDFNGKLEELRCVPRPPQATRAVAALR